MKETVVITGGGGFIGHHLAKSLSERHDVIVLDNFSRGNPGRLINLANSINVKACDITNYADIEIALKDIKIDKLFHLAAINGTENFYTVPLRVLDVGVFGCFNILKYAKNNSIKKVIVASSAEVYQDCKTIPTPEDVPLIVPNVQNPRYSYGLSKIYSEYYSYHFGQQNNMNISIFRPHNVYGTDMGLKHVIPQFIMEFLKGEKNRDSFVNINVKGQLEAVRAFCYVDDIIEGINLISEFNEGVNVYNIGNPTTISMNSLLEQISLLMKMKFDIIINRDEHIGGTQLRCPDISKIKKLGFKPSISLDIGLKKTINWYRDNFDGLEKADKDLY